FSHPNKFNWLWDRVLADPKAQATLKASSGRLAGTLGNTSFDVTPAPDAMQFVRWVQMDAPQIESVVQEDSLLRVGFDGRAAMVRLGSITDLTGLREVWLRDSYGLGRVAGRLGTVVDLGGNIGMFTLRAAGLASRVIT